MITGDENENNYSKKVVVYADVPRYQFGSRIAFVGQVSDTVRSGGRREGRERNIGR